MKFILLGAVAITAFLIFAPSATADPLSLDDLRSLQTKEGATAEVQRLCQSWNWELIAASAFVHKDFAGDKHYMVDKAQVVDQRSGRQFVVGIVLNTYTGMANSMSEDSLSVFLQMGEMPASGRQANLDVN